MNYSPLDLSTSRPLDLKHFDLQTVADSSPGAPIIEQGRTLTEPEPSPELQEYLEFPQFRQSPAYEEFLQWREYKEWQELQNSTELQQEFDNFQDTLEEYQSIGYETLRQLFDTHFVDDGPTEINYLPLPGYDGINYRVNESFDSLVLTLEFEYINRDGVKDSYFRFFFFDPEGEIAHTSNSLPATIITPIDTEIDPSSNCNQQGQNDVAHAQSFDFYFPTIEELDHVNQSSAPGDLSHINNYKKLDDTERDIVYGLLGII